MVSIADRLSTDDLEIHYGANSPSILMQLTLGVRAGELVGVIGPNGAGKSTLVRALSRTLRPARGVVLLAGQDLYGHVSARESAQQIGVVPQDTQVAFDFSVREVVEMGRSPRLSRRPFAAPTPADAAVVQEAMRLAGVEHLAGRAVTTLSGGERQRTLMARALAQEPDVLLLDEPTAHLDLHHQTQALSLVRELAHRHGKAVLAVLHDLNLAAAFCDRLLLLHQGAIVAQGTPEEVLTSSLLSHVYGVRAWVRRHPGTGRPFLLPLPEDGVTAAADRPTVHVLCGGGSGAVLLFALVRGGYRVTAGGLNAGDTDAEAADILGVPYPQETPFSPLSPEVTAESERLAGQAGAVILAEVPFGQANLATLNAARVAQQSGKRVVCVQAPGMPFHTRDFMEGRATALWNALCAAGATVVADADAALTEIAVLFE